MTRPDPRDPQRDRLYEWEREAIEAHLPPEVMSREEVRDLIAAASSVLGMPEPEVAFKTLPVPCRAIPAHWRIEISEWGRTRVTVLHEIAHLATLPAMRRGEEPHGGAFLGMAIALYARFIGLDGAALVRSARAEGLIVVPVRLAGRPPEPSADEGRFFEDLDF